MQLMQRIPWDAIQHDAPFQAALQALGAAISKQLFEPTPTLSLGGSLALHNGPSMTRALEATLEAVNAGGKLAVPDLWAALCQSAADVELERLQEFVKAQEMMITSLAVCKARGETERTARIGSFWKAVSAAKAPNAVADTYARQLSDKAKAVLADVAATIEKSARARCREIVVKVAEEFQADLRKRRGGLQKAIGKDELLGFVEKMSKDATRRLEDQVGEWGLSREVKDELLRDWNARSEEHARAAIALNDKLAREERQRALAQEEARQQKERAELAAREERARQRERELEKERRAEAQRRLEEEVVRARQVQQEQYYQQRRLIDKEIQRQIRVRQNDERQYMMEMMFMMSGGGSRRTGGYRSGGGHCLGLRFYKGGQFLPGGGRAPPGGCWA
jgi:hypothetical protein